MSLFLDLKFINEVAHSLLMFKKKDEYRFNFRCPICGDSQKNSRKARGWFIKFADQMFMKCHNCGYAKPFGAFLKEYNAPLFSRYSLEKYRPGNGELRFDDPKPSTTVEPEVPARLIDSLLDRLDTLDDDNIAVQFCLKRKIPREKFNQLYYVDDVKKIEQLSSKYKDKIQSHEPRLVLPFYDFKGQLTGVSCRALGDEALRYIHIKIKEDVPLIFGTETLNRNKRVYVTEGQIDALFIPNAIAVSGIAFTKIGTLGIPKNRMTVIIDNQPRNKEVVKVYKKFIDEGHEIVIWPQNLEEKDLNDMILSGLTSKQIQTIIDKNTFSGLEAEIKLMAWKRI
jgi:hypothetical protein